MLFFTSDASQMPVLIVEVRLISAIVRIVLIVAWIRSSHHKHLFLWSQGSVLVVAGIRLDDRRDPFWCSQGSILVSQVVVRSDPANACQERGPP
jgi:hypothetical protein